MAVKGLDLDFWGRIRGATIRLRCFVTGMEFERLVARTVLFHFILLGLCLSRTGGMVFSRYNTFIGFRRIF